MAKSVMNAEIREFFGMSESAFDREWPKLNMHEKSQIRGGLTDGTLSY